MRWVASAATTVLALLSAGIHAAPADQPGAVGLPSEEILLWPGAPPGSEDLVLEEHILERSRDPNRRDRAVTGILIPTLTVVRPVSPNGAAVIVAPGGAYERVVIDKEGLDAAEWLSGLGVTALVLTYRLPTEGHTAAANVPLEDAQRAVRVVRCRSETLGIDPRRIGVLGFSAGGHLAGSLAGNPDSGLYAPVDDADACSARPDFVILAYPWVGSRFVQPETLASDPQRRLLLTRYPLESAVSKQWPPTFLFQTADDAAAPAEGTVRLFLALRASGVPAEIHIFAGDGHGFGIKDARGPAAQWPMLCGEWLRALGILGTP